MSHVFEVLVSLSVGDDSWFAWRVVSALLKGKRTSPHFFLRPHHDLLDRNFILSLWYKNVNHVLAEDECIGA